MPPLALARLIAIGVVTDFGPSEASSASGRPNRPPTATALAIETSEPSVSAQTIGTRVARTRPRLR